MDERTRTLTIERDGAPRDLFVRYTLPVNALRGSELEIMDLELGMWLVHAAPAERVLEGLFGAALHAGDAFSCQHNVSAVKHSWYFPHEAMQELKEWLVAVGVIEGALLKPRGRVSALAERVEGSVR